MKTSTVILVALPALLLAGCNLSLAADVTPPPNYAWPSTEETRTPPEESPAVGGSIFPPVSPNPEDGETIYAEKCAPCHGALGRGDGPRAAQLPAPVPAIGTLAVSRQAAPAEWFRVVTEGNLERYMPPFNSLSDRQRWDVIAYTFSLSYSTSQIAEGEDLFQSNCLKCHQSTSLAQSEQAGNLQAADLLDQERMANLSAESMASAILNGAGERMPAFANQLSEQEVWALTGYLRSQTFSSSPAIAGQEAASARDAPSPPGLPLAAIRGSIIPAGGAELPVGAEVFLHGFDQMEMVVTQKATVAPDGSFLFENIEIPPGRMFLATIEYEGATYSSEVAAAEGEAVDLELPIQVFPSTTDLSELVVDRLHLFLEFTGPKTLRVIQLYVVSNPGEKAVVPASAGAPVLQFKLPPKATNLEFQDGVLGERFIKTDDGFADTIPLRPGAGVYQVLFSYELPYNQKLVLEQPITLPAEAIVVLTPSGNMTVKGNLLEDVGNREVQGANFRMYNRPRLAAGEVLTLTISGSPQNLSGGLAASNRTSLVVGLVSLGAALIGAGAWLHRHSRRNTAPVEMLDDKPVSDNAETIMDSILALDDLNAAGKLTPDAYRQRRRELAARLKELLMEKDSDPG